MTSINRTFFFLIGLTFTFLQFSCSVEKRVYMSGYHTDWKKWKQNSYNQELVSNDNKKKEEQNKMLPTEIYPVDNTIIASTDNSIIFTVPNKISLLKTVIQLKKKINSIKVRPLDECDIIILRNGDEIKAKITEIGISEIKYKKCDFQEGPLYTVNKDKVFMIKYSSGQKDVFTISEETQQIESKTTTKKVDNISKTVQSQESKSNTFAIMKNVFWIISLIFFIAALLTDLIVFWLLDAGFLILALIFMLIDTTQ